MRDSRNAAAALAVRPAGELGAADLSAGARAWAQRARSDATRRAYAADWETWRAWADARGAPAMPARPGDLCDWMIDRARRVRPSTIERALASLSVAHKAAGFPSPTGDPAVRAVFAGIRRTLGTAPRRVSPLTLPELDAAVAACPPTLQGSRDRAILTLGVSGAFRRSELAALEVRHLAADADGWTITLERSKTDPEAHGRRVGIPHGPVPERCAACCLSGWLDQAGIRSGPIFRRLVGDSVSRSGITGRTVADVVRAAMARAGVAGDWAGHSLRAGHVTAAMRAGVAPDLIMRQTGHRRVEQLLAYYRDADVLGRNSAKAAGI